VFALEKRGYLKAGPWTPEVTVEHPQAGDFSYYSLPTRNVLYDFTQFSIYTNCVGFYSVSSQT